VGFWGWFGLFLGFGSFGHQQLLIYIISHYIIQVYLDSYHRNRASVDAIDFIQAITLEKAYHPSFTGLEIFNPRQLQRQNSNLFIIDSSVRLIFCSNLIIKLIFHFGI
jgi:hypothetical protein